MSESDRALWAMYAAAAVEGICSRYPISGDDQSSFDHIVKQAKIMADTMMKSTPPVVGQGTRIADKKSER